MILFLETNAYAFSCKNLLNSSRAEQSLFTNGALDYWQSLEGDFQRYPLINRDPTHEEILEKIEEFRKYALSVHAQRSSLDAASKIIFDQLYDHMNFEIDRFVNWYSSNIWPIAEVFKDIKGLIGMNSRIRGHLFEARAFVLLHYSGYRNIRPAQTLYDLRRIADAEDQLSRNEKRFLYERRATEIDFLASKDGINYVIEVKTFIPIAHRRFFKNMEKAKTQMLKRREFLNLLGLSSWKTALVFQYNMDQNILDEYFEGVADVYFGLEEFNEPRNPNFVNPE